MEVISLKELKGKDKDASKIEFAWYPFPDLAKLICTNL